MYGPGVDQVWADQRADDSVVWLLTDHEGSVRDVVNSSGVIVNHIDYNSFGVMTQSAPTYSVAFTYTGREYDAATDLYYYRVATMMEPAASSTRTLRASMPAT